MRHSKPVRLETAPTGWAKVSSSHLPALGTESRFIGDLSGARTPDVSGIYQAGNDG